MFKEIIDAVKSLAPQDNFHVAACNLADKAQVSVMLDRETHLFSDGVGERLKEITIKITLPVDVVLQGHEGISKDFAACAVTALVENIAGELEIAMDETLTDDNN